MIRFILILLAGAAVFSCGKPENSSSQDRALYTRRAAGSPQFDAAASAIANKCSECHASWSGYSEADFKQSGLIVGANIDSSKIYYRSQTASSGPGPRNMPSAGRPTFTAVETTAVVDWINSVAP